MQTADGSYSITVDAIDYIAIVSNRDQKIEVMDESGMVAMANRDSTYETLTYQHGVDGNYKHQRSLYLSDALEIAAWLASTHPSN